MDFVEVDAPVVNDASFELELGDGRRLRIPAGFDPDALVRLLGVLEPAAMIPASVRIFVWSEPVDMRFGFDRLAAIARTKVREDPCGGSALFVFEDSRTRRIQGCLKLGRDLTAR